MCFALASSPPVRAISGGAVSQRQLGLEAADGNRLAAFAALPDEPQPAGVVVLPDVRGLYHFYEELALRLAERGYTAIAIDYFGRTAGAEKRGDDFEDPEPVKQTAPDGVQADVGTAVEWLREQGMSYVFTLGFCFGGHHSWL